MALNATEVPPGGLSRFGVEVARLKQRLMDLSPENLNGFICDCSSIAEFNLAKVLFLRWSSLMCSYRGILEVSGTGLALNGFTFGLRLVSGGGISTKSIAILDINLLDVAKSSIIFSSSSLGPLNNRREQGTD